MQGKNARLILASASPRRRQILQNAGIQFEVQIVPVDEEQVRASAPHDLVMARARLKAEAVVSQLPVNPHLDGDKPRGTGTEAGAGFVIGADTVVVLDGHVLGKPRDEAHARHMLQRLSATDHEVLTGVAVCPVGRWESSVPVEEVGRGDGARSARMRFEGATLMSYEVTRVTMGNLSADVINRYIATGEPLDKAGAYGIQERGGLLVDRIEGDYFNVVGLPLATLRDMLAVCGFQLLHVA